MGVKIDNNSPVVLVIRDGWGENYNTDQDTCNAIKRAYTPCANSLKKNWPRTELCAWGLDVGLPEGIMGNSEVGHQNIGAGRIVDQEIVRINKGLEGNQLLDNPTFDSMVKYMKRTGGKMHIMGLGSDGGVHSSIDHIQSLLCIAKKAGIEDVCIHIFTDGRDTPPHSSLGYIKMIELWCQSLGIGRIASVIGRYWAMDRDKRWDRVERAYRCLTEKQSIGWESPIKAISHYYENPLESTMEGDEFVVPSQIQVNNVPVGIIQEGDAVIFINFRGDRTRELTEAFIQDTFGGFARGRKKDLFFVTMTEYQVGLCEHVLFRKPPKMEDILGSYIAQLGIGQFRCAETEKYPHVTFFFNDYREHPFEGEVWHMVPSPREVPTYDLKPEMSARLVAKAASEAIRSGQYGFIVVNFANADMVGHTGNLEAAIRAVEEVDRGVQVILEAVDSVGGKAIVTADHGNADQMWDYENDMPHTRHTLNPVELVVYGAGYETVKLRSRGRLADIAPTVLDMMGYAKPLAMTGVSLIESWG